MNSERGLFQRPATYVSATVILLVARIVIGFWIGHDIPYAIGAATGTILWGVIPAAIYWFVSGRSEQDGKFRTMRVMFWCAFILPFINQSLPKST
jgi:hypothetical protein